MAEQEQLRWLLEPPGAGRAHVYVAIGEGTKLSPAVQEAIDKLMAALQETDDDVHGFWGDCSCLGNNALVGRADIIQNPANLNISQCARALSCNISGMRSGL